MRSFIVIVIAAFFSFSCVNAAVSQDELLQHAIDQTGKANGGELHPSEVTEHTPDAHAWDNVLKQHGASSVQEFLNRYRPADRKLKLDANGKLIRNDNGRALHEQE